MEHPKNVYFDLNKALEYIEKYEHNIVKSFRALLMRNQIDKAVLIKGLIQMQLRDYKQAIDTLDSIKDQSLRVKKSIHYKIYKCYSKVPGNNKEEESFHLS